MSDNVLVLLIVVAQFYIPTAWMLLLCLSLKYKEHDDVPFKKFSFREKVVFIFCIPFAVILMSGAYVGIWLKKLFTKKS